MATTLMAGAAVTDISPNNSQFLFGYPHVPRQSTGIHDPLLSSSLYLCNGSEEVIIVANDTLYLSKDSCGRIRARIAEDTGIPHSHIMLTATHTHSAPVTANVLACSNDPIVPLADEEYVRFVEEQIFESAIKARAAAQPAEIGLAVTRAPNSQTNRHDPNGPSDPEIPVLAVRSANSHAYIACMVVYSVHPTVLHEDSTLVSSDFPGFTRQYLQDTVLGSECPVVYHTGPAGNQSPRYILSTNDFVAARRLGLEVGKTIKKVIPSIKYLQHIDIAVEQTKLELIPRVLPSVAEAEERLQQTIVQLQHLRQTKAPAKVVRTAECDWFGAEEALTLAQAALDGRLQSAYLASMPCEILAWKLGPWAFVAWPGEIFVEYSLQTRKMYKDTFVISLANGELQGYIVTEDAVRRKSYEAGNALYDYKSGERIVEATARLLNRLRNASAPVAPTMSRV